MEDKDEKLSLRDGVIFTEDGVVAIVRWHFRKNVFGPPVGKGALGQNQAWKVRFMRLDAFAIELHIHCVRSYPLCFICLFMLY
jgi:hypothetical protein